LRLFPLPLLVLTVILVVIPTSIAIFARITLHRYLQDQISKVSRLLNCGDSRGLQPKILENLENRYKRASNELESVNTVALISSAYGQEQISVLGFKLRCDRAENLCRILPNLLLAFGLLGTFWGITSNLYNIGEAINQVSQAGTDIGALVQQLLPQLQGMGIAFLTSLIGLLCSSLITITNFVFNTGWAKYRLIACLEDYLDNIYKPTVEGDTRLDKAVNRMVEQQQEFLTRFHEKVGQVLETSFGHAANQIAEECGKINKLAEQVYTQFAQSAGTIATGATTFQQSAQSLEKQTQTVAQLIPQFQTSTEMMYLGTSHFLSAAEKIEQSNAIAHLEKITIDLSTTQQAFTQSTLSLEVGLQGIMSSNLQATQLAEKVYSQLQNSSSQIKKGSESFLKAANLIQKSSFAAQLETAADKWGLAQKDFTASTAMFNQASHNLEPVIGSLYATSQSLECLGTQILQLSQDSLKATESNQKSIASREQQFLSTQQNFEQILSNLSQTTSQVESSLQRLHENWLTKAAEQLSAHKEQNGQLFQSMERHIAQISDHQRSLNELLKTVSDAGNNLHNLGNIWTNASSEQLNTYERRSGHMVEKMEQCIAQIETNQRHLNTLIETATAELSNSFNSNTANLTNAFTKNMENLFTQIPTSSISQSRPSSSTSSLLEATITRNGESF
jgi:ABC-type transporter Mla subunit MlaD